MTVALPAAAQSPPVAVPPAPPIVATPTGSVPAPPPTFSSPPADLAPPPAETALPPPDVTSSPPANADTGGPAVGTPATGATGDAATANPAAGTSNPAPPADSWLPGTTAELGVLDEVDGSVTQLSIGVGGQKKIGDLLVSVLACLRRPPDQIPDAAAFVAVEPAGGTASTDGTSDDASQDNSSQDNAAPSARGWMLRSAPGAAVIGDGSETFRVVDCG